MKQTTVKPEYVNNQLSELMANLISEWQHFEYVVSIVECDSASIDSILKCDSTVLFTVQV